MATTLNRRDFNKLSSFIYRELGIKMPDTKITMLTGRLNKRLRVLKLPNFSAYCDFLFSPAGLEEEMVHLINAVTTNKTEFFREPTHFDYLRHKALPLLLDKPHLSQRRSLKIWSAGCSSGEEPYTLAMVLTEAAQTLPDLRFDILATDISDRVLEVARRAIYPLETTKPIPPLLCKKYLLRRRDPSVREVRIAPDLRKRVKFGRLNFMDEDFGLPDRMDVIFCRNVIIYFDKPTQEKLILKFCRYLQPGGYLFLGHSESLHGYDIPLVPMAPTVYRKRR